jgi:hypothetical protein
MKSHQVCSILEDLRERVARLEAGIGAARFGKKTPFLGMQSGEGGVGGMVRKTLAARYKMFYFEGTPANMHWFEFNLTSNRLFITNEEAVHESFRSHPAIMFDNRASVALNYRADPDFTPFRGLLITGLFGMKPSSKDLGPVQQIEFSKFNSVDNIQANCRIIADLMRADYEIVESGDDTHRITLTQPPL